MADNIAFTPGSGGSLAADDISGVHFVRNKLVIGADGANDGDVCLSNPLPVINKQDTSRLYDGATLLTPKFADIDTTMSGDNDIVAAVTSKKIRVLAFNVIAVGTAVNVYFHDDTPTKLFASSTRPIVLDKTGATGPGGFNSGYCPVGWFETASGKKLQLNLSTGQGVIGKVVYVEVT